MLQGAGGQAEKWAIQIVPEARSENDEARMVLDERWLVGDLQVGVTVGSLSSLAASGD